MEKVHKAQRLETLLARSEMLLLYFSGKRCLACAAILGKLKPILAQYPKVVAIEVDAEQEGEIAASYDVFSLPVCILFVEGREVVRFGRNLSMMQLEEKLDRYYTMLYESRE
ncbi:MAG: thioredoxin family protein [Erysipelotrichaceae bacterium]